mgnify:CR=1 FL=1|jgi:hypothetical protein
MFNRDSNLMPKIVIAFKSIDDWGKLVLKHRPTRVEF